MKKIYAIVSFALALPFFANASEDIQISDLSATATSDGILIKWSEPIDLSENPSYTTMNEGFEDYELFDYSRNFSHWINYYPYPSNALTYALDGDDDALYTGYDFPRNGESKGWQVMSLAGVGPFYPLEPHSGTQFLYTTCIVPEYGYGCEVSDAWLISPITRGGSEVSFFARALYNDVVPEIFEFMYSSTSRGTSEFIKIEQCSLQSNEWVEFKYTLPEDAKYFAIHFISDDMYGMMLDDITYEVQDNIPNNILGYNIYRKTGSSRDLLVENFALCSYTDIYCRYNVTYEYEVCPLYPDETGEKEYIEGPMSNTASAMLTEPEDAVKGVYADDATIATVTNRTITANADVDIYTLSGAKLASVAANGSIEVEAGIYIIKSNKAVSKIFVK